MLQFTAAQATAFAAKPGVNAIREYLRQATQLVEGHFLIPPSKAATWSGFYACPEHSVRLDFDIASEKEHRCPVDGKMITGQPYDGAWWRLVNEANQQACHHSALLYLLDKNPKDLALARKYLIEYAKAYPGYEVHGGIPYNNPGKANAQTLCDAGWVKGLIFAYDIIRDELPKDEQTLIEQNLFRCCGEFLMEYRSNQIHNHEVVVDSAIAMIGLLIEEEKFLSFGLNEKYGMKYQLEHGLFADGLWFEGTPGYHFYMFQQFMFFEMLAQNTKYSVFNNPKIIEALKFPLNILQPDGTLPPLNDAGAGYSGFLGTEDIFELAYAKTGDTAFLDLLHCVYKTRPRCNVYSFFFGADALPEREFPKAVEYHGGGKNASGLTTMLGENDRFLLVKHSPFGGEHDHYDRLGIHFMGFGRPVLPDIGTSLYGAPLHYSYYKNTASHNTVCLNGKNQPPANCKVYRYEKTPEHTLLDVGVKWDGSYKPLDSLVLKQWDDEAYEGASFRRVIAWYGNFFIDIFKVDLPQARTIDYTLHVQGSLEQHPETTPAATPWAKDGAAAFLHEAQKIALQENTVKTVWGADKGIKLEAITFLNSGIQGFYLLGPDNPATQDLGYMVQRVNGTAAVFANVISVYQEGAPTVQSAEFSALQNGELGIKVSTPDDKEYFFSHVFEA